LKHYDYIIAGGGCAGLSLLTRMIAAGCVEGKKILLLDQSEKKTNDRTWCFWEKEAGFFEPVVFCDWNQLSFHSDQVSSVFDIAPYQYKMIRGGDFYNYCFDQIRKTDVEIAFGKIGSISDSGAHAEVVFEAETLTADYVFSSINSGKLRPQPGKHYLLQHFKGWHIKTEQDCFNVSVANLMDFRVSQLRGHCFVYLLPFSANEALIECTFFSENVVEERVYAEILERYIEQYLATNFQILATETGVIPMTNHVFPKDSKHVKFLGTAGGYTKPSSGYTFKFIQEHTKALVDSIVENGVPVSPKRPARFYYYDSLLLDVLKNSQANVVEIFEWLFLKNNTVDVLDFLNSDSNPQQEFSIISTLPKKPFIQAAWREIGKKMLLRT